MNPVAALAELPASSPSCYAHPDIRGGLVACRTCQRDACVDCRESQFGSGVPVVFCAECAAGQRRRAMIRRAGTMALVTAVIFILAIVLHNGILFIPGVISLAFMYLRFRNGWNTPFMGFGLFNLRRWF